MDFGFSDEQKELRELARKILGDLATNERLKDLESKNLPFDEELWRELARANLLGITVPESLGGLGFGFFELCLLLSEIGRAVAPAPVYASLVLGALPITEHGNDAQRATWLPQVASGEAILTGALVELEADDPTRPLTRAESTANGFTLHGQKSLVPAAQLAARILVPARCDDGRIGIFLVNPELPGVEIEKQTTMDRQAYGQLSLDGAIVDEGDLVGDLDSGATILEAWVQQATVALCAVQLGVGERALEMTAEYARERVQFDRPIGSFQAVHQRAADAFIQMEAMRLTLWEAALMLASGDGGPRLDDAISIAKYWASEGGQFTAYACQHLHGGIGIDVDYPLHRYFIWSSQLEHSLGCASEHLARIGSRIAERGIPA